MPRKPAPLELVGGKGQRQRVWDRIRALKGSDFDLAEITLGAECKSTVRDYTIGLERAGYLVVTQAHISGGRNRQRRWQLARDTGAEAPRVRKDGTPVTMGLAQEQMWRTLRMLKADTNARELAAHASTPDIPVRESAAHDYLRNLHLAGYLECVKPGKGVGRGGIQARLRLISNTGPRPPMVCRAHAVYDPNLGKTVWVKPVTEEDAIYGS
jgi:hypothetical protein